MAFRAGTHNNAQLGTRGVAIEYFSAWPTGHNHNYTIWLHDSAWQRSSECMQISMSFSVAPVLSLRNENSPLALTSATFGKPWGYRPRDDTGEYRWANLRGDRGRPRANCWAGEGPADGVDKRQSRTIALVVDFKLCQCQSSHLWWWVRRHQHRRFNGLTGVWCRSIQKTRWKTWSDTS